MLDRSLVLEREAHDMDWLFRAAERMTTNIMSNIIAEIDGECKDN